MMTKWWSFVETLKSHREDHFFCALFILGCPPRPKESDQWSSQEVSHPWDDDALWNVFSGKIIFFSTVGGVKFFLLIPTPSPYEVEFFTNKVEIPSQDITRKTLLEHSKGPVTKCWQPYHRMGIEVKSLEIDVRRRKMQKSIIDGMLRLYPWIPSCDECGILRKKRFLFKNS